MFIAVTLMIVAFSTAGTAAESEHTRDEVQADERTQLPETAMAEVGIEKTDDLEFIDTYPGKLVPFVGMGTAVAIVWIVFGFVRQCDKMRHDTIKQYLDKGLEVPWELLVDSGNPQTWKPGSDLRKGFVWLAIGLGLGLTACILSGNPRSLALGLIFDFIGIGYLIAWKIAPKASENHEDRSA